MARKETLLGKKRGSRTKVIVIIAVIAVILGVAGYFWWTKTHPAGPSMDEMAYQPQTQVAVRQDVEKLFAANGKVVSGEEGMVAVGTQQTQGNKANTTASGNQAITGDKIAEVFVHVGDLVHKGDALYSLDITELQGDLALQQQKLALSQQANYISQQAANRAVSNAQQNSAQQYNDATRHLVESADDTNHAIVDLIELQQKEADAKAAYDKASAEFNSIEGNYKQKVASRDALAQERDSLDAKIKYDQVMHPENYKSSTTVSVSDEQKRLAELTLEQKKDAARVAKEQAEAQAQTVEQKALAESTYEASLASAEAEYAAATAGKTVETTNVTDDQKRLEQLTYDAKVAAADLSAIENSYTTAKTNYDKAKSEYETAKTARENAEKDLRVKSTRDMENQASSTLTESRSTYDAEQAARDSAAQARISNQSSLLDSEEAIRKTQEKINNSVIYAGMDGTVTAVNVTAGATYSGNNAVVINNLEKMKVIASIEEGHIADLSVGQRVYIKTDSTGADPLMGTVTYTALTPNNEDTSSSGSGTGGSTPSTTGTKTKATYRVEVTLDEVNERLRIGMNANLEFILGSAKDCIAVPTSCIIDDGMGGSFVRVVQYDDEMNRETSEIEVTTGLADDYYTEITSGNITEGTEIEDPNDMGMMGGADTGLLDGMY